MTASVPGPTPTSRLYILDRYSKISFLIDTGADICVFPLKNTPGLRKKSEYELSAANGTPISTYGTISFTLNLGLRRDFIWSFVVADVSKPIIGADFLAHYALLPDLRNKQLLDSYTSLKSKGVMMKCSTPTVKTVSGTSPYHTLLVQYPQITRPLGTPAPIKHNTRHHILTTPGPPVALKARRLAPEKHKIARQEFESMVNLGLARRSESSWAASLHLVPKKEAGWRPCGDYRALNARTIPDKYPVKYIEDFAQALHGCTIFSTIDLVKAFHQIPVAAEDVPKTAIITPFGLFEFPFMTFGLRNAAQSFQRFIDEVLRELDFCFAYIDDIIVASKSENDHIRHLEIIFKRFQEYGVIINAKKCCFGQTNVKFRGYNINAQGTQPTPEKVAAIQAYPQPTTIKELRRFLGVINFYRRFIPNAAETQVPLNELLQGNVKGKTKIVWTSQRVSAFQKCKKDLVKATLLEHPKANAPVAVFCDASDYAIGAALQQQINNE